MAGEKSDIFPEEVKNCKDNTVRLTRQEWNSVADFVLGIADLIEQEILGETAEHEERKEAIANM